MYCVLWLTWQARPRESQREVDFVIWALAEWMAEGPNRDFSLDFSGQKPVQLEGQT
jgi:hypothetical protein